MTIFIGTGANEIITPGFVSGTVSPFGFVPSGAADELYGGAGNDTLNGGGGSDSQFGGSGNDYVYAVIGIDNADGGTDIDTLDTSLFGSNYVVNLATGLTNFGGESFINFENLISGAGNDSLTGTGGNNSISGGDGNDTINGAGGNDSSYGGNGNDYIHAVLGTDIADGGVGTDTLDTTAFIGNYVVNLATGLTNWVGESLVNFENLISGAGSDSLTGTGSANSISGGDGNDTINGAGGADSSYGGNGNDYIYAVLGTDIADGGVGTDTLDTTPWAGDYVVNLATGLTNFGGESFINFENLISGAGNDSLTGTGGNNSISGGDGNDTINGAGGNDSSYGGNGNDYIYAVLGTDIADGGVGTDTLDTTAFIGNYVVNLATGLTNWVGESYVSFENLITGDGNDTLVGTAGNNRITSGNGADQVDGDLGSDNLSGGAGLDTLFGNTGNDKLRGGTEQDVLIGGLGQDQFIFAAGDRSAGANADILRAGGGATAFEGAGAAVGDLIDLSAIDANKTVAGNQAFVLGGGGTGELLILNSGADTVVFGNIDADATFEFRLIIEDGAVLASAYTAADFIL